MAYKDLTFLLFAKDMSASRGFEKVALSADGMSKGISGAMGMAGVAVAGLAISLAAKSVQMAGDFQAATTRLVTDAGESSKTMGKLSAGLLDISASTGTSATDIAQGMYKVSSAGYTMAHGGLAVMKAAAEGAKVGGADLVTVADALTTVLKDYGPAAGTATQATDALIATVSHGKTNLEDLAGSLHNVLPNAQALGISLKDVLGALASMTQEGISADQATQNLNHTIVSLANPTSVMANEMTSLGLSSTKVSAQLGKKGITGTLQELAAAVRDKMGPQGLVVENIMNHSANATALANAEFKKLRPQVQATAAAFKAGTITQKTWTSAVKAMTPENANQAKQWAANQNAATGFSKALSSGTGPMHTYTADLAKITGGQVGLQVALHLTGIHASDVTANVNAIGKAAKSTSKDVQDWTLIQSTHNQQMSEWNAWVGKVAINIGTALLPAVDKFTANLIDGGNQWGQIFRALGGGIKAVNGVWQTALQGMGTDVYLWVGHVQGAIRGVRHAFAGAAGWLLTAGKDIMGGLDRGIRHAFPAVSRTLDWVTSLIPAGVRKGLQINSPSKVMIPIGSSVGEGLALGVLGSAKQVASATKSLTTMVIGMFDGKKIGSRTESAALRTIRSDTHTLILEANKRAALAKQITAAEKKLTGDLKAQKKASDSSLRDSVMSDGNITSFAAPGDAVQGLQALLGNTRRFKSDLQKLVKKGIDSNTLKELIGAGVSGGGLTMADQLLANPTDFKEIVGLQKQLASSAGGLASFAGQAEYGSTIAGDRSRLATLKGAQRVETWKSQKTAAGMINAIAKETHVHIHLTGHYAGTKDELAKSVTTAIRDAVRRGQLPKNVLTAL